MARSAVEGLQENTKAIVQVELTMEYLNPYVSSLDVVCKEKSGGQSVKQTLDVNNFEVRGGEFKFYVPDGGGAECSFLFENLKSNYADNTYYNGEGNGTSRYNFVNSEYWTSGKARNFTKAMIRMQLTIPRFPQLWREQSLSVSVILTNLTTQVLPATCASLKNIRSQSKHIRLRPNPVPENSKLSSFQWAKKALLICLLPMSLVTI